MGKLITLLISTLVIYFCGKTMLAGVNDYLAADAPLPAIAKTEALMWQLTEGASDAKYKEFYLVNNEQKYKICADTNGYIECSRFMSKRVPGVCPAPSAPQKNLPCLQSLGHRLQVEPIVVVYNGTDVVSVTRANGEPVLKPSEWAAMHKGYVQREAAWQIGISGVLVLGALMALGT